MVSPAHERHSRKRAVNFFENSSCHAQPLAHGGARNEQHTMKNSTSFNCIAYVGHSLEKTVVTVDAKTTREAWGKADAQLRKTNRIVQMLDIKEVGHV